MSDATERAIAKYWSKVVVTNEGCWEWSGGLNNKGYGDITVSENNKTRHWLAHRLSFELANGPIPSGMCVLHRCDNPPCSNPEHLRLGTQRDNIRDARDKGRLNLSGLEIGQRQSGPGSRGSLNPRRRRAA